MDNYLSIINFNHFFTLILQKKSVIIKPVTLKEDKDGGKMTFVIGIDGGGSKTRGVLFGQDGEIYKDITVGPSNYHVIGIEKVKKTLSDLLESLCLSVSVCDVEHIYFGLAGADIEVDFKQLNNAISSITDRPFTVANDIWCAFKSNALQDWGVVSIYGTGANAAAVGKNGDVFTLRALGHLLGGGGGGYDIACEALHYAFRSEEGTYIKTALEEKIPEIFGKGALSELVSMMHPTFSLSETHFKQITPLVFHLAAKGDKVACEILEKFGRLQGQMVSGVLRKAALTEDKVPVVLGGSIYKGESSIFIDAMMLEIQGVAPHAYVVWPQLPPVAGALIYAQKLAGWSVLHPKM